MVQLHGGDAADDLAAADDEGVDGVLLQLVEAGQCVTAFPIAAPLGGEDAGDKAEKQGGDEEKGQPFPSTGEVWFPFHLLQPPCLRNSGGRFI